MRSLLFPLGPGTHSVLWENLCNTIIFQFMGHLPGEWTSLVAQIVKNLPAMQKTWVQSLGWKDLPEKGMTTHSSILAWRILWTEEPDGLQSIGSQRHD